jgi:Nsp2, transmembrane domain
MPCDIAIAMGCLRRMFIPKPARRAETHMDHLHRAYTYKHRREVVAHERQSSGRPRPITSPQAATPGEVALKSEALPLPRPRLGYRAITVEESEALVDWFDHLTGNRTSTAAPSPPDASPW